jgi:LmbE family N-acetylglucosaminyl deacetylase
MSPAAVLRTPAILSLDAHFSVKCFFRRKSLRNFGQALHIRYNQPMFRMMCITAHPDDEAGWFGGSLRTYRDRGAETCVICLTPGQAGSYRGDAKNDRELAELRKREFAASCEILRVSKAIVLDYPDGQLYRQELNRVAYELVLQIRRFRPHVMLTFGPEGGVTGHPDHSMAGIFATVSFHWAGRTNRYPDQLANGTRPHLPHKLYFTTSDKPLPNRQPLTFSPESACIEVGEHLETKIAAFKAHTTQKPLWEIFETDMRRRGSVEMFHLAASLKPGTARMERDLFEGIEDLG